MPESWLTIAPVNNPWCLPDDLVLPCQLCEDVFLRPLPDWLLEKESEESVDLLRPKLLEAIDKDVRHCIAVEYEADAFGSPDPNWKGTEPRSIQDSAFEKIQHVFFALWLVRPTSLHFREVAHAAKHGTEWIIRQIATYDPRCQLPEYADNEHQTEDFESLRALIKALCDLPQGGTLRIATHSTIRALTEQDWVLRFLVLWIVLESLFGPEDPRETTFRLSQRVALFLSKNGVEARELFSQVKASYGWRSKVVHGFRLAKLTSDESQKLISQLELLVRRSIMAVLSNKSLLSTFDSKNREEYLDSLAFK